MYVFYIEILGYTLHKPEMDSQASMFTRTFQTYPDAICNAHPLRVVSATFKTFLKKNSTYDMTYHNLLIPPQSPY